MSVEERLAQLAASIDAHPVDAGPALMEVETMAMEQKTRRNELVAVVAAAVVVIAGLVWGPGLLGTSGGETDTAVAGTPGDPAAVLAEYQQARNANPVREVDPADFWLDSLMSLYAEDAVVTGHPLDDGDPPIATGLEEIARLESQVGPSEVDSPFSQRAAHATEYFDVEVSGNQAAFRTHFFNKYGECFGGSGRDQITVEDGKITRWEWGEGANEPCDPRWFQLGARSPELLAQAYAHGWSVKFTGDACRYWGPTDEFTVGDSFDVRAVDTSDKRYDVGYAVEKVVDGTTIADAQAQGLDELGDEDSRTYIWSKTTQEGTQRFMSATLDVAGTWLVYCFLPSEGTQLYAATLGVVE